MRRLLGWFTCFAVASSSSLLWAATVVVPPGNEFTEGDSNNGFPFRLSEAFRYQQLYDAAAFGGQRGVVEEIRFRVDEIDTSFLNVPIDLEVKLSHTSVTPATRSTTFSDNIGADETLVLSGSISLSGTGGAPNPFDVVLNIADVFFYNGFEIYFSTSGEPAARCRSN